MGYCETPLFHVKHHLDERQLKTETEAYGSIILDIRKTDRGDYKLKPMNQKSIKEHGAFSG